MTPRRDVTTLLDAALEASVTHGTLERGEAWLVRWYWIVYVAPHLKKQTAKVRDKPTKEETDHGKS